MTDRDEPPPGAYAAAEAQVAAVRDDPSSRLAFDGAALSRADGQRAAALVPAGGVVVHAVRANSSAL